MEITASPPNQKASDVCRDKTEKLLGTKNKSMTLLFNVILGLI